MSCWASLRCFKVYSESFSVLEAYKVRAGMEAVALKTYCLYSKPVQLNCQHFLLLSVRLCRSRVLWKGLDGNIIQWKLSQRFTYR